MREVQANSCDSPLDSFNILITKCVVLQHLLASSLQFVCVYKINNFLLEGHDVLPHTRETNHLTFISAFVIITFFFSHVSNICERPDIMFPRLQDILRSLQQIGIFFYLIPVHILFTAARRNNGPGTQLWATPVIIDSWKIMLPPNYNPLTSIS